jgi:hypothetical protein
MTDNDEILALIRDEEVSMCLRHAPHSAMAAWLLPVLAPAMVAACPCGLLRAGLRAAMRHDCVDAASWLAFLWACMRRALIRAGSVRGSWRL